MSWRIRAVCLSLSVAFSSALLAAELTDSVSLRAETVRLANSVLVLNGRVRIQTQKFVIESNEATISVVSGQILASGNVRTSRTSPSASRMPLGAEGLSMNMNSEQVRLAIKLPSTH